MPIAIRNWVAFTLCINSDSLRLFEPEERLDFFVYISPNPNYDLDALRANFHLHVFMESDIAHVASGEEVAVRIRSILPKTSAGAHVRPDLVNVPPVNWRQTVDAMNPNCAATTEAARRFASVVESFMCNCRVGCSHHGVPNANYGQMLTTANQIGPVS